MAVLYGDNQQQGFRAPVSGDVIRGVAGASAFCVQETRA